MKDFYYDKIVKMLAKCSCEIFLIQMSSIAVITSFGFIYNEHTAFILKVTLAWTISISGGYIFNEYYSKFKKEY